MPWGSVWRHGVPGRSSTASTDRGLVSSASSACAPDPSTSATAGSLLVRRPRGHARRSTLPDITYHCGGGSPAAVALLLATRLRVPRRGSAATFLWSSRRRWRREHVLGRLLRYRYGWDAGSSTASARGPAGPPSAQGDYDYLSLYPEQPAPARDRPGGGRRRCQALGLAPDAVLITLNGLCVAVTLYAVHVLVVRVAGRGPALVAQLAPRSRRLSPVAGVPYTDFYAMPLRRGGAGPGRPAWPRPGELGSRPVAPRRRVGSRWPTPSRRHPSSRRGHRRPPPGGTSSAISTRTSARDRRRRRQRAGAVAGAVSALAVSRRGAAPHWCSRGRLGRRPARIATAFAPAPVVGRQRLGREGRPRQRACQLRGLQPAHGRRARGRDQAQMSDYARSYLADRLAGARSARHARLLRGQGWPGTGATGCSGRGARARDSLPGVFAPATGVTGDLHDLNGFHGAATSSRAK